MNKHELDMCVRLIAKHDNDALERLYHELSDPIYRFSLMILHDHHLAEDAMQTTFLKIMAGAGSYKPESNPRSWIFAIARNVCMDLCCMRVPVTEDEVLDLLPEKNDIGEVTESLAVREAVKKLTATEREILSLYVFAGLKQTEISKIMKIPYTKVRSHYKYAIQKLRKDLGDRNER